MGDAGDWTTKVSGDALGASFGCNEGWSWRHFRSEERFRIRVKYVSRQVGRSIDQDNHH